jgi:hypothetical protein
MKLPLDMVSFIFPSICLTETIILVFFVQNENNSKGTSWHDVVTRIWYANILVPRPKLGRPSQWAARAWAWGRGWYANWKNPTKSHPRSQP